MITLSYTISPYLKKELEAIENIRNSLLLIQINRSDEIRFRWEALIERIDYSLKLRNINMKHDEITRLMRPSAKKKLKKNEAAISYYKRSYDYILQNWRINPDMISAYHINLLYEYFTDSSLSVSEKDVKTALSFLQVKEDHPIIQSAVAYILFLYLTGKANYQTKAFGLLISYLFLYKNGYEFAGLLNLEEYFVQHQKSFDGIVESSFRSRNISGYLDHFILAVVTQAERAKAIIKERKFKIHYPKSYFNLSQRHKEILSYLDEPAGRITNKVVQKLFRISQITASRDLAKLASLGLLFSAGKGRSVYYTKV